MSQSVEVGLITQFDTELHEMNEKLDKFEENLTNWQPSVLKTLTENRKKIQ